MLGNPSLIELNGVKILMYHGQGLDDIIADDTWFDILETCRSNEDIT